MKDYKDIDKIIVEFCEMVCGLTENILIGASVSREIKSKADELFTFAGAWWQRCDDTMETPLTPDDDLQFAIDTWYSLTRFKKAITDSELANREKLLEGISNAEAFLKTLLPNIDSYIIRHEYDEDLLSHQIRLLFKQYGILNVQRTCYYLSCRLNNRAAIEQFLSADDWGC